MSLLRIDNVGARGFQPDVEPWQLEVNSWTDLRDVSLSENSLRPPYLTQELLATAGLGIDNVFISTTLHKVGGAAFLVLCTTKKVYITRGQTLEDVTPIGFEFSADTDKRWQFSSFNGFLLLNNGRDEPYYWPLTGVSTAIAYLKPLSEYPGESPWEKGQSCEFIVGFNSQLFAGNIRNASGIYPYLVLFSDFAEPGTLPQQWYPTPANSAGSRDIAEGLDEIVGALPFKDQLLVRKENSVVSFTYRGGQFVYNRRTIAEDTSCLNRHCIANTKDFQVVIGSSDIYATTGGEHKSLAKNRVKNWFFDNINILGREKVFCIVHAEESEVWFFAPHGESQYCNIALIWNYLEDTFTTRSCDRYLSAVEGNGLLPDGFVSWGDLTETWGTWTALWGLPEEILRQNRLVFVQAKEILEDNYTRRVLIGGGSNPVPEVDEIYLERMHIPFPRGERMDWESIKQISYIAPKCRKESPNFYIDIWLGVQDDIDSPIRWYGPKRWRPGRKNVFFDRSGRFISIRARLPADKDFRLTGYDIEYKLVSRR